MTDLLYLTDCYLKEFEAMVAAVEGDRAALARTAQKHYARAQEYLKEGNWAKYGEELKRMEEALDRLVEMVGPGGGKE